jgi:hypothetical protein
MVERNYTYDELWMVLHLRVGLGGTLSALTGIPMLRVQLLVSYRKSAVLELHM